MLTPEETAGPYPLFSDIASASTYMREDIVLGLQPARQQHALQVYTSSLDAAREQNTSVSSFSADSVFSNGEQYQLCTMNENAATAGYDAALTVGIAL